MYHQTQRIQCWYIPEEWPTIGTDSVCWNLAKSFACVSCTKRLTNPCSSHLHFRRLAMMHFQSRPASWTILFPHLTGIPVRQCVQPVVLFGSIWSINVEKSDHHFVSLYWRTLPTGEPIFRTTRPAHLQKWTTWWWAIRCVQTVLVHFLMVQLARWMNYPKISASLRHLQAHTCREEHHSRASNWYNCATPMDSCWHAPNADIQNVTFCSSWLHTRAINNSNSCGITCVGIGCYQRSGSTWCVDSKSLSDRKTDKYKACFTPNSIIRFWDNRCGPRIWTCKGVSPSIAHN